LKSVYADANYSKMGILSYQTIISVNLMFSFI